MWLASWSAPTVRVMERCQTHNRTPVILANAHCVKARGFFWSACDCPAYQTHVILWSKMDKRQPKISQSARRFIKLIGTWRRRARSRRELTARTDRELRDLGITRYDASREAAKRLWRETATDIGDDFSAQPSMSPMAL